jgi:hypothetical protein
MFTKYWVNETKSWQNSKLRNDKLTQPQSYKTRSKQYSQSKKQQADEMESWQNHKLNKRKVNKGENLQNNKLKKQVNKMTG